MMKFTRLFSSLIILGIPAASMAAEEASTMRELFDSIQSTADLPKLSNLQSLGLFSDAPYYTTLEITSRSNQERFSTKIPFVQNEIPQLRCLNIFTKLKNLTLDGIPLGEDFTVLQNLTNLENLAIKESALDKHLPVLKEMTNLKYLNLFGNRFHEGVHPLSTLTNLTELRLIHNSVRGDLSPLAQLTNLKKLSLFGGGYGTSTNGFCEKYVSALIPLKKLGTQIDLDCLSEPTKQKLPEDIKQALGLIKPKEKVDMITPIFSLQNSSSAPQSPPSTSSFDPVHLLALLTKMERVMKLSPHWRPLLQRYYGESTAYFIQNKGKTEKMIMIDIYERLLFLILRVCENQQEIEIVQTRKKFLPEWIEELSKSEM